MFKPASSPEKICSWHKKKHFHPDLDDHTMKRLILSKKENIRHLFIFMLFCYGHCLPEQIQTSEHDYRYLFSLLHCTVWWKQFYLIVESTTSINFCFLMNITIKTNVINMSKQAKLTFNDLQTEKRNQILYKPVIYFMF